MIKELKTIICAVLAAMLCALNGCSSLSQMEYREYKQLEKQGVDINHPIGDYIPPNSLILAGVLNLLPGFGNFYLALGEGSKGEHAVFGFINLLFWPISIVWGVPEAAFDANNLNKIDMLYYYRYSPDGKKALEQRGIKLD